MVGANGTGGQIVEPAGEHCVGAFVTGHFVRTGGHTVTVGVAHFVTYGGHCVSTRGQTVTVAVVHLLTSGGHLVSATGQTVLTAGH